MKGQKMYTFYINLEIGFILKKSTFSLKCFILIAFLWKNFFKTCFINHRIPFFMNKFKFYPLPLNYFLTHGGFEKSCGAFRKDINVE